jgi:hypothetical protein
VETSLTISRVVSEIEFLDHTGSGGKGDPLAQLQFIDELFGLTI